MTTSTAERQSGGVATGLVEYQMRFREIIARAAEAGEHAIAAPKSYGPFLTISREAGSGGAEVARKIGSQLAWAVLDKELVDGLADDLKLEPRILDLMDETRANWFSETLLNLFNSRLVSQHSYVDLIGKVVALAASNGRTVIVGRGAHLVLPQEHGLRVRVISPKSKRVESIAINEGLTKEAAAKYVDELDADRQHFIRRNFKFDVTDSSQYDLIVNSGALGLDLSAEVIVRTLELRGFSRRSGLA